MIAADQPNRRSGKLLTLEATGAIRHVMRADLASQFHPGDVVIANHASTLPASLSGTHRKTGDAIEVRLAAWVEAFDPSRFVAIAFGAGDYLTPTEERGAPPALSAGDHLELGSLVAVVERLLDHPRLFVLRFLCNRGCILSGIARSGRPIQYAHVPEPLALWDVWTSVAANPIAFEPPSAGFALNWRKLTSLRSRGVTIATLAHAAGISSTGDPRARRATSLRRAVRHTRANGGDRQSSEGSRRSDSRGGHHGGARPGVCSESRRHGEIRGRRCPKSNWPRNQASCRGCDPHRHAWAGRKPLRATPGVR